MSLSTTWTENSTVAFTAGTLSTITDCVTEVEDKLKRGTLSTTSSPTSTAVQRWLIRAKEELCEDKHYTWTRRYSYADTTAGTHRYALPADYNGGQCTLRDLTNNYLVEIWPSYQFDLRFPDMSEEDSDEPLIACIKDRELWIGPPAGGVYRLEFEYARSGDDSTTTDFSYLPELARFWCCDYALYESFESLHMFEQAKWYRAKWEANVTKAKKGDARKKWAKTNFQAKSWLQDFQNRLHQQ